MAHNIRLAVLLMAVVSAPSAWADYKAGQRAWDEGRPDAALTEWQSAAASGDRRAMLALGRLFVQGLGAPQDYVEAHKWLNLAASRGEAAASKERDALTAKMTLEQVATAQAQATAWRPATAASAASPSTSSTGGFFPAMAELLIQRSQVYRLFKLMEEDPEKFAHDARAVAQELQKGMKGAAPAFSFKSQCAGAAKATPRWKDVANKPGCRVWVNCYVPDSAVTWSGTCSGGVAEGQGTLEWSEGEKTHTGTGAYSNGKRRGRWVFRQADGTVAGGPFLDGKPHGRWILRYANGIVAEGPFVDGEMLGRWVLRGANGTVAEGPLVDGKPHGRWVRDRDGKVTETVYVDGVPR